MYAVDQHAEVDADRWHGLFRTSFFIGCRRIVAEHAILGILANGAMQCQVVMTGIAPFALDHRAAGLGLAVTQGDISDRIEPGDPDRVFDTFDLLHHIPFQAKGVTASRIVGHGVLKGVAEGAIIGFFGCRRVFGRRAVDGFRHPIDKVRRRLGQRDGHVVHIARSNGFAAVISHSESHRRRFAGGDIRHLNDFEVHAPNL